MSIWFNSILGAIRALLLAATLLLGASGNAIAAPPNVVPAGVPSDWSHRHLIFPRSAPTLAMQRLLASGRSDAFARWAKLDREPRFLMQVRGAAAAGELAKRGNVAIPSAIVRDPGAATQRAVIRPVKKPRSKVARDWNMLAAASTSTTAVNLGQFPAKFSFLTDTARCDSAASPDFVVYSTGVTGSGTVPSIIAYDNLYKTQCAGPVPMIYWQYNTGGVIPNSVVMSYYDNGAQIAFVQLVGTSARLVLLKWVKNSALVTLTAVSAASYRTCTAPCMTSITFSGGPNATNSSPYYDYANDVIYVGDNNGRLHKFQNIFLAGTPSEITTGWPVTTATGNILPSPVYDPVSDRVFVGSPNGRIYRVGAAGGAATASAILTRGCGWRSSPILDPLAGMAYFFAAGYTNSTTESCATPSAGPLIAQVPVNFASNATWGAITGYYEGDPGFGGQQNGTGIAFAGAFDDAYYNSSNPASPSGKIYFCANSPTPRLYQAVITSNVMADPFDATITPKGPSLASVATGGNPTCAPVTEFVNAAQGVEYLFVGVTASTGGTTSYTCGGQAGLGGANITAGAGCVSSFNITGSPILTTTTPTFATPLAFLGGGPSGIVIDNALSDVTTPGASNVYFSTVRTQTCVGNGAGAGAGTGYCAMQATQAGLN